MAHAAYAGSFDPPTLGHKDIIDRILSIFDAVTVIIAINPQKKSMFSGEERKSMLEMLYGDRKNLKIGLCEGLVTHYMKDNNINTLVRGLRGVSDWDDEASLAWWNGKINPGIETLLLPARPGLSFVSSSKVKELLFMGGDISPFVPQVVVDKIKTKFYNIHNKNLRG
jgi:pantetheine-phosphate adenylyltransferase